MQPKSWELCSVWWEVLGFWPWDVASKVILGELLWGGKGDPGYIEILQKVGSLNVKRSLQIKENQISVKVKVKSLSLVRLFATPRSVAYQAPPSVGLSRQEYWSGLPFLSPGDLPNPGIEPGSPALQADALPS